MFILASFSSLDRSPAIALTADPWRSYRNGALSLEPFSEYEGYFKEGTPLLEVRRCVDPIRPTGRTTFKYRPLERGEIRLIRVLPGHADEPLRGTISHVPIDKPDAFWAISYRWDDPGSVVTEDMALEVPGEGRIELQPSLNAALRVLRAKGVASRFWADAVCINQHDLHEKALQIRLMGDIFRRSDCAVAWLGGEYDGSRGAIDALARASSSGDVPDWRAYIWGNIGRLLSREWFRRVWIVQEVVLPPRVILLCGEESEIEWDDFFRGLIVCEKKLNAGVGATSGNGLSFSHAWPAHALGQARGRHEEKGRFGLLELLEMFAYTQSKLEVDKLFALLGLAYDADNERFNPDTASSLPEVVQRYAEGFVLQGEALKLLYRAGASKSYPFCSWIPRWTASNVEFPRTISNWDDGRFSAGGPPQQCFTTGNQLVVRGYIVDSVQTLHSIRMGNGESFNRFDAASDFRELVKHATRYASGEERDAVLVTLPIGHARRAHLESKHDKLQANCGLAVMKAKPKPWPANLAEIVLSDGPGEGPRGQSEADTLKQYWETAAAFSYRLYRAAFCFTTKNYVGLVPSAAIEGDSICLVHGGQVPFILRRDGQSYRLVGECYIDGIMHGEARNLGLDEVTIEIA